MSDSKRTNDILDSFHGYMLDILNLYRDVVLVLKKELDYINNDNIEKLNEALKTQQAVLFQTKAFDKKIAEYLSELGISANNLTEVIPQLPKNNQLRFYALLGQFEQTVSEVNFYKEKCKTLLESKLYYIEKSLSKLNVHNDNSTYNQNAAEIRGSFFSKSFEKKI